MRSRPTPTPGHPIHSTYVSRYQSIVKLSETECAYFDLSSYSPDPESWEEWEWPAKLWTIVRDREFDSAVESVGEFATGTPAEPTDEQRSGSATVGAVVNGSGSDLTPLEVLREVVDSAPRFPSSCPHASGEREVCPLHAPPSVGRSLAEYVTANRRYDLTGGNFSTVDLTEVETEGRTTRKVVLDFCRIGELRLDDGAIENPLSVRDARVGTVSAGRGRFGGAVDFERTTFESALTARDAVFDGQLHAKGVRFRPDADVTLKRVRFRSHVCFNDATFRGGLSLWNSVFDGDAEFRFADVRGPVDANWADFHRYADFHGARFRSDVDFGGAFFHESLGLSEAEVEGDLSLSAGYDVFDGFRATIGSVADLTDLTVEGRFDARRTEFVGAASLEGVSVGEATDLRDATFEEVADFTDATFGGDFDARSARFERDARFVETVFEADAALEEAEFAQSVRFDEAVAESQIDLSGSTLSDGCIRQPDGGSTYYDLSKATVGSVDLRPREANLFDHYRIHETRFDGFEFTHHLELLTSNWRLHRYTPDVAVPQPSAAALVSTYLKAKNGADRVGAKTAASEFFIREMRFRRRLNWKVAASSDRPTVERVTNFGRWLSNWFFNITCGYGERALRTVGMSVALIVVFAPFYWLLGAPRSETLLGAVSFSAQAFVTLIFGYTSSASPTSVQFLGAVEGFIGAFSIALFVFTLTRSIHR